MQVLYICGQRPGSGSTAVAAGVTAALRRVGRRVAAIKLAASSAAGIADGTADAIFLAGLGGLRDVQAPQQPQAADTAAAAVQALGAHADVAVVDGLPLDIDSAALARRLGAVVVGVVPYARTLGAADAAPWRDAFGDAFAGVVLNRRTRYAEHDAPARVAPSFAGAGVPVLGILPEERLLLAPTVEAVVAHVGGTFFNRPDAAGGLIEHILIGGLITEWGGNYFGRYPNQAVVARGGRVDIQMAALNFPLQCLVLTGVKEPPQYVYQRAQEQEVALVVVPTTTAETANALHTVHERATVHHPQKAERMADLLQAAPEWPRLARVAGTA